MSLQLDEFINELPDNVTGEDCSGSTAICTLVGPETIYLANCGNSRAIVVSQEMVALATYDHKPINPLEEERIEKVGGYVHNEYVCGSLAASRALGDFRVQTRAKYGPL